GRLSAGEPEVEELADRAGAAGGARDRQRTAGVVVQARASGDGEVVKLAEPDGPGGNELSSREADRERAGAPEAPRERADILTGADRLRRDPAVEELDEDELLVARAEPGAPDVDPRVAELPVGDPDELGAGGGGRFQASVGDKSSEDDGRRQQP